MTQWKRQLAVRTASQATDIALSFVSKHRPFALARTLKAVREDGTWSVEVDVGVVAVRVAKIKIDADTGDILEYNFPA